ncbi:hypothetical protein, partial [Escherichia coli]|uniref:hypothetical protein n=1 Tax=Escherichia coli TaxID=562 RepID=UPI001BC87622
KGWAIFLRQKQKKLIMLPSEIMIWQPEFTDKTLSRKPGAVHSPGKPGRFRWVWSQRLHPVCSFSFCYGDAAK